MVISLSMILSGAKNDTLEELKTLLNLNTLNNQQIFDLAMQREEEEEGQHTTAIDKLF